MFNNLFETYFYGIGCPKQLGSPKAGPVFKFAMHYNLLGFFPLGLLCVAVGHRRSCGESRARRAAGYTTDGIKRLGLLLVGKILSNKSVNRGAFIGVIPKIWRTMVAVEIEVIEGNIFSFTFKYVEVRRQVLMGDFRRANSVPSDKVANVSVEKRKWKPPAEGLFKINTDAAINGSLGHVGIGIIIRDSAGHVMASSSPQSAEAVAILRGLQLARDSGLWPCSIESDALSVVMLMNSKAIPCAEIGLAIQDILSLVDKLSICEVSFVQRDANMAAH
ncbi:hypothetical protein Ddye_031924 [Dipteronia dyeriana]|uniref:RNase H type-1 domain-containing protein n=1 Tax=Dipteronia dyeriana TaxID=168575 RepID=A0AAD9TJB3_9ROSI|nr:hypothetical protein Ddye_031924 [Dipteronia dyeriana]